MLVVALSRLHTGAAARPYLTFWSWGGGGGVAEASGGQNSPFCYFFPQICMKNTFFWVGPGGPPKYGPVLI
jgi:hypothetical protein